MTTVRTSIKFEKTLALQSKLELISEYNGDCTKFKSKVRNEVSKVLVKLKQQAKEAQASGKLAAHAYYNAYINLSELQVTVTDGGLFAYMIFRLKSGYTVEVSFGTSISDTLYRAVMQL